MTATGVFLISTILLFVGMALVLARLYGGPTLYDRVIAANAFGTFTVLFIAVLGFLTGRPDFLDIALLYALINFVGTIAILKYFRYRAIGDYSPARLGEQSNESGLRDQKDEPIAPQTGVQS